MNKARTLFLIPARGGSKGIPGKNIKLLGGKPLIQYALDNAKAVAAYGDVICVSTDSDEIADVAASCGFPVPFMRPEELATDKSGTYEVIMHALDFFRENGVEFEKVVLLQATSPFCRPEDVKGAMDLWSPDVDMVVSVTEAATNPYYNAFETDKDGFLHISKGEGLITRRQDAPKVWEYNGAVYVMSVDALMREPYSKFKRRVPFPMARELSVDLDTPLDWMVAEMIIRENKRF